jgi:hypothetical protein
MVERKKITKPEEKEKKINEDKSPDDSDSLGDFKMTLQQFLQNPTGPKSALFARRDLIKQNLESRYEKLKKDYGKFKFRIYKIEKDYLFHFLTPSEEFGDKLFYDAILYFKADEESEKDSRINDYELNFWSNSPNFTFTYTYILKNKYKILADLMIPKTSKIALKEKPRIRNPVESLGFEKSCYFSALAIRELDLNKKSEIDKVLSPWKPKIFFASIKSSEGKLLENQKLKKKEKQEKDKDKKRKIIDKKNLLNDKKKAKIKKNTKKPK